MINPSLEGRGVLVTGTNNPSGIGAAVALAFARLGARLLHFARTPYEHTAGTESTGSSK